MSFSSRVGRVASFLALTTHQPTVFLYQGGCDWKKAQAASFFMSTPA